ncbi:hypothetical protein D1872_213190 [compost metagenome]
MERGRRSRFRLRRVERAENLFFFLCRQQVQLGNLRIWTAYDRFEQLLVMFRQPFDRLPFVESRRIFEAVIQAAVLLAHIQADIKLRGI